MCVNSKDVCSVDRDFEVSSLSLMLLDSGDKLVACEILLTL